VSVGVGAGVNPDSATLLSSSPRVSSGPSSFSRSSSSASEFETVSCAVNYRAEQLSMREIKA